jgi:hypothetical protein
MAIDRPVCNSPPANASNPEIAICRADNGCAAYTSSDTVLITPKSPAVALIETTNPATNAHRLATTTATR